MHKAILCVIDFSESSLNALRWAAELSHQFGSHLTVLYPYRLLQAKKGDEIIQFKKKTEETAAQKFELIEKNLLRGKGISFDFRSEIGFLTDRIEDRVKKNSLLFLVIGKSVGLANKENFDELINHIQIPLVIVP